MRFCILARWQRCGFMAGKGNTLDTVVLSPVSSYSFEYSLECIYQYEKKKKTNIEDLTIHVIFFNFDENSRRSQRENVARERQNTV